MAQDSARSSINSVRPGSSTRDDHLRLGSGECRNVGLLRVVPLLLWPYDDLSEAFDFVNFGQPMEHFAYISLDSGAIYWVSEASDVEQDLPEDLDTSDRYLAIPHKNDLDLGRQLALQFTDAELPAGDHFQ